MYRYRVVAGSRKEPQGVLVHDAPSREAAVKAVREKYRGTLTTLPAFYVERYLHALEARKP